jgi:glycosyltransferase involved in cell wall biosynthesis
MKIDFIISRLNGGGAERVMVILAGFFADKGHEVRIVTLNPYKDYYTLNPKVKLVKLDKKINQAPFIRLVNFISLLGYYFKKQNRPDIVISFIVFTNLISILVCRLLGIPIIASEHNNHHFISYPIWLNRITWRFIYPLANCITVLTKYDLDFFKKFGCNTVVMPNPCTFEPLSNSKTFRNNSIIAIGNLNRYHQKGFDNLIPIVSKILKKHPDWDLKIVGEGDKGLKLIQDQILSEKLNDRIHFLGFKNDVSGLFRENSILILPSRMEGLPMVLLEAMSQGMAVIAYDCITGPSEIISNGEDGLLIRNQDMAAMQIGLEKLITDNHLRENIGNKAIKAIENYSIDTIYEKWSRLIKSL